MYCPFLSFFVGLVFEFQALCLQSRYFTARATPQSIFYFSLVILEMGSCELFA
jgi:hypothetical protein